MDHDQYEEVNNLTEQAMDRIQSTYESLSRTKRSMNDDYLSFMEGWYPGNITYVGIEYLRSDIDSSGHKASLSWRLTPKELESIEHTLALPQNQRAFEEIEAFFREGD